MNLYKIDVKIIKIISWEGSHPIKKMKKMKGHKGNDTSVQADITLA
jgi:hypothetical protein